MTSRLAASVAAWLRGRRSRRARTRRLAFCTIATRGFLPWALVLFDSLRRHHPRATLVLLYVGEDLDDRALPQINGVQVVASREIVPAEREAELRRRYSMPELCFALKPGLLRLALERFGERAIYLDSDIHVEGPLEEAAIALEGAAVVLTPHLDGPIPLDLKLPSEVTILRAGACNLGFVGVADTRETREILDWWGSRVERWGFVAPEAGYHGDQKLMDLGPAMFPAIAFLRDPGSNVGCWNLHGRWIAVEDGRVKANGAPLAFFHFSGFDPDRPAVLSKYQNRIAEADQPVVMEMARRFAAQVVAARERAAALRWSGGAERPPASTEATIGNREMPEAAYRCQVSAHQPEGTFETLEEVVLEATVTNASTHPWAVGRSDEGAGGIALTWHLRAAPGGEMLAWDNPRTYLPRDLAPGESLRMRIGVRLPGRADRYVIELDLLHEGFAWFSERGNSTYWVYLRAGVFDKPPG
jgi:hypothetical protein